MVSFASWFRVLAVGCWCQHAAGQWRISHCALRCCSPLLIAVVNGTSSAIIKRAPLSFIISLPSCYVQEPSGVFNVIHFFAFLPSVIRSAKSTRGCCCGRSDSVSEGESGYWCISPHCSTSMIITLLVLLVMLSLLFPFLVLDLTCHLYHRANIGLTEAAVWILISPRDLWNCA